MFTETYFWLYRTIEKNKFNKEPDLSAYFLLSSFQGMNIATLLGIVNYFIDVLIPKNVVIMFAPILFLSILVINYLFLYRKRIKIIKKFDGFSTRRKTIGKILFVLYIIASVSLLFFVIKNFVPVRY